MQDQQPGNWIQERPIELEPAKLDQSGQTLAQTLGQLQRRQLRPRAQQLSNSGQSTALKSQVAMMSTTFLFYFFSLFIISNMKYEYSNTLAMELSINIK